jgi:hypothetical protein
VICLAPRARRTCAPSTPSGVSARLLSFTVLERTGQAIVETKRGSCHCGAVQFEVDLDHGFEKLRRCNCSLCRRKGAVMASVTIDRLRVTKGQDKLSLYQWNTRQAKHYFCSVCGIYTHHQRRSVPGEFGFNVACIEGVDPYAFGDVPIGDGASASVV